MFRQAIVLHTMLLLMTTEITKNRKFSIQDFKTLSRMEVIIDFPRTIINRCTKVSENDATFGKRCSFFRVPCHCKVIMFRRAIVLHTMLLLMTTDITKNRKFSIQDFKTLSRMEVFIDFPRMIINRCIKVPKMMQLLKNDAAFSEFDAIAISA
jgi:hypothetical protein